MRRFWRSRMEQQYLFFDNSKIPACRGAALGGGSDAKHRCLYLKETPLRVFTKE